VLFFVASLSPKNPQDFLGTPCPRGGVCEHRSLAPRASLRSTLAMLIGIFFDAHVAEKYGIYHKNTSYFEKSVISYGLLYYCKRQLFVIQ
jgi:hypothetical protein